MGCDPTPRLLEKKLSTSSDGSGGSSEVVKSITKYAWADETRVKIYCRLRGSAHR